MQSLSKLSTAVTKEAYIQGMNNRDEHSNYHLSFRRPPGHKFTNMGSPCCFKPLSHYKKDTKQMTVVELNIALMLGGYTLVTR